MLAEIKDWLGVIAIFVSLAGMLYTVLTRPGKEAGDKAQEVGKTAEGKITALEKRMTDAFVERDRDIDTLQERVSRVEGELKGLPNRDQMHDVQLEMERLRGSINQLSAEFKGSIEILTERLKPVQAMATRTQEALMGAQK